MGMCSSMRELVQVIVLLKVEGNIEHGGPRIEGLGLLIQGGKNTSGK